MDWKTLPRKGTWEIDIVEVPELLVKDVALQGLLLVVDVQQGLVRIAAPLAVGESLDAGLSEAVVAPTAPCVPGRPRRIRCRRALRARLRDFSEAVHAEVKVVGRLSTVGPVVESLREHFVSGPPRLPSAPAPWREPVAELVAAAPWTAVSDAVQFLFARGNELLGDAVALLIGQAGEQRGLVIYPDPEDFQGFMQRASGDDPSATWTCWCVHLDPIAEISESHLPMAEHLGLVFDGFALQVFAVEDMAVVPLTGGQESACLAAVQAVLAAWRQHGASLEHRPSVTSLAVEQTEFTVVSVPGGRMDEPGPLLLEAEHRVILEHPDPASGEAPVLILKFTKRNALRLAKMVEGIDALSVACPGGGEVEIIGWAGPRPLGVLARLPDEPGAWDPWRRSRGGWLVISGGGPRRSGVRSRDYVARLEVDFLTNTSDDLGQGMESALLDGASWEGPPERWPKASTVLLAFLGPMGIDQMPLALARQALELGAAVWSAVVSADEGGDASMLDTLLGAFQAAPELVAVTEELVERKRALFAQDRRLFKVDEVDIVLGELKVVVSWTSQLGRPVGD